MRLLVIGGCGFLGCNFIRYFLGHYHAGFITNVDLEMHPGNHQNLNEVPATYHERYEFFHADVRSPDAMNDIFSRHRYFAVIHFASETSVAAIPTVLEIATRHRVDRIVHATSENSAVLASLAAATSASDLESITLCSTSVYGPNQWALAPLPTRIRHLLEGSSTAAETCNDWLHVDDFCSAIMAVMLSGSPGMTYVAGPDHSIPNHLLESWILTAVEQRAQVSHDESNPLPQPLDDSAALRDAVEWRPIIHPKDGIRDVVYWYLYFRARLLP